MPAGYRVAGTDVFHRVARDLKTAGRGDLARKMTKRMRAAAQPLVDEQKQTVLGLQTRVARDGQRVARRKRVGKTKAELARDRRSGTSARQERALHALRNRRKASERVKSKAWGAAGLRKAVARATAATASATGNRAAVRVRARQAAMPPSQRKLPRHLNRGKWRHPTFGQEPWVTQQVKPGWFDDPARRRGPRVREAGHAVVIEILHDLAR